MSSKILVFTLIFQSLVSSAFASSLKCENLFATAVHEKAGFIIDQRYGHADQLDSRLEAAQVIEKNKSMLCGPTCVYNVLEKFKINKNQKLMPDNEIKDIIDYVHHTFPKQGVKSQDLIKTGSNIFTLAAVINEISKQKELNLIAEVRSPKSMGILDAIVEKKFSINDLKKSTLENHAAIVLVGYYKTTNLLEISNTNRMAGHYMIVAGHNPAETNQLIFLDPENPLRYRKVELALVKPQGFSGATYQVFDPSFSKYPIVAVIEQVLLISSKD